ncbi:MAG TPA: SDR family oxidoreductase, partial [Anaeromyxobacter sp.]|nr:SDR family oxidoreductase [Anaeromyxobacter sp.]
MIEPSKTILLTGATSGIGLAAGLALADTGAELLLVGRDPSRLKAAQAAVRARSAAGAVSTFRCDLSSLAAVRALASDVLARHPRLDVLVNNAGGVSARRELTADGLERTFAVNHLAPYLLTRLLLDRLRESAPSRIVNVASVAHRGGELDFSDLEMARGYRTMRAYRRSKLANVLFTRELARRLSGTRVTANSVHPGVVATDIWGGAGWYARPLLALAKPFMLTPEKGAATLVHLAVSPEVESLSGAYFEGGRPVEPSSP